MEIPIQVVVRVFPDFNYVSECIHISPVEQNNDSSQICQNTIEVENKTFPVSQILPIESTQSMVYFHTVYPLITSFMEGYDSSIVLYGQKHTGKTFTLFGPGFDCIYGESEQGIIQRCIREIFTQLSNQTERQYILNMGWLELCEEQIHDVLEGMVQLNSIPEAFQWLQIGLSNRSSISTHCSLSLTLEQKWVTTEGLIQHRLSTFSFCDLAGTERTTSNSSHDSEFLKLKDWGLQNLEKIVTSLTDTNKVYKKNIDYNKSALTTLVKDSFGGRAQTVMILCISPLKNNLTETLSNLQFARQVQLVRNFVVMNTFSDNNIPVSIEPLMEDEMETCGLQFAASQWLKLVSNAEGLFRNLMNSSSLPEQDREQIEEWMFLKAECEDCLSSNEISVGKLKPLIPIQEDNEDDEESENDNINRRNSDNETDTESQGPDIGEKVSNLMIKFRNDTDNIIKEKYEEFKKLNPKAIFDSSDSLKSIGKSKNLKDRRRSIQPGSSLSSAEIAMLNKVANTDPSSKLKPHDEFLDNSVDLNALRAIQPKENIKKKIIKIDTDIDATQRQVKELEHTISLKQKLIADLIRNNDTRTTAKQRFNKKKNKVESEYEKAKKALSKAIVNNVDKNEIEKLKSITSHLEQRLQDLASIKHIASENGQKVKKLQKSLQESQKNLDALQKSLKKQHKYKDNLENELKEEKSKKKSSNLSRGKKNLCEVAARISHLDHVLKEKSQTLEQYSDIGEKESLRHEIRNLRRTRDHLIEQRCHLDKKLKKEKSLSHTEERKLLECDEAIEAIDAAIEFKNELICGRKSVDTNEKLQREKGEKMLMARLNNLSSEEMRTLIYKYFQKVIDLRDSSRKLEIHLIDLERERDAWEWRERVLTNAVRQARLEGERHAVLLQRQHETKLTLMLRHLAEESSVNSSTTDKFLPSSSALSNYSDQDLGMDIYKPGSSKTYQSTKQSDMGLYALPVENHLSQYKNLEKFKDKDRETKNKLFQKIQVLTRYHGSDKRKLPVNIPHENLKQLNSSTAPATKVTREKNKIIIQQNLQRN